MLTKAEKRAKTVQEFCNAGYCADYPAFIIQSCRCNKGCADLRAWRKYKANKKGGKK